MKRITKLQQLMEHAEIAAKRSHDSETQVGCVLVDSSKHTALASACNGFVHGVRDHKLPNTRPYKYSYICHSEENLIASCARRGQSTDGHYIVCTMSPCVKCMRLLYQSGIKKVIVKDKYRDFEDLKKMMDLEILEAKTEEGYVELNYRPKQPLVLVVGSNPSNDSPDLTAFHPNTKSGKKVRSWFNISEANIHYTNVSYKKTLANRPLTISEIKQEVPTLTAELHTIRPDAVIAVGSAAKKALDLIGVKYFHIPHPSGLSRFWNSKDDSENAVQALRDYISKV